MHIFQRHEAVYSSTQPTATTACRRPFYFRAWEGAHRQERKLLMPPFHGEQIQTHGRLICELTEQDEFIAQGQGVLCSYSDTESHWK